MSLVVREGAVCLVALRDGHCNCMHPLIRGLREDKLCGTLQAMAPYHAWSSLTATEYESNV